MSRLKVLFDAQRCIGCRACEVLCANAHNEPCTVAAARCRIAASAPAMHAEAVCITFKRVACRQCPAPRCVDACPTGAMEQTADGVVQVNRLLCSGCMACRAACPWHVPAQLDGIACVCDLCKARREDGVQPACVTGCPAGALRLQG